MAVTKRVSRRSQIALPAVPLPPPAQIFGGPAQPTIWEALNEPVVEVTEKFAKTMLFIAAFMLVVAWVVPYWGVAQEAVPAFTYASPLLAPSSGIVAGAATQAAPVWYEVAVAAPGNTLAAFGVATAQVLDISDAVSALNFFQPGVHTVWNAWLDLMKDPGT